MLLTDDLRHKLFHSGSRPLWGGYLNCYNGSVDFYFFGKPRFPWVSDSQFNFSPAKFE